jgi:hypothetical protein
MTDVAELLDRLVPPTSGTGDWECVLRDARLERRRPLWRPYRLAAVAALVAVIAGVVAFWPAGNGTGGSVLDRALAATGEGTVLHMIYEGEQPRTLVDLETGERTEVRSQNEIWFDPEAGFRQTETFDGVVQFDVVLGRDEMQEHTTSIYSSLGAGYREALESGRAEVVGEDTVDGTAVYWIRIEDGHDVAVSKDSYEPTYIRVTMNGTPALTRIVSYETVESGSAPLDAQRTLPGPQDVTTSYGAETDLAEAASLLGREPVWAGSSLQGLPLDSVREVSMPTSEGPVPGLSLAYGSFEGGSPHVELIESATAAEGLTMLVGVRGYVPPEGTALVGGSQALVSINGLVIVIHAPDEETAISVARLLEPYSG